MLPCAFPSSQYYEMHQMRPLEFEIRPKSDSNRYTNRVQKKRAATVAAANQQKKQRTIRKRTKRNKKKQEKQVKNVEKESEKKELESLKSLYDDQPSTSTEVVASGRTLRKRTNSAMSTPKTVNIEKAKDEIKLRTCQTRTTRSGRISNVISK